MITLVLHYCLDRAHSFGEYVRCFTGRADRCLSITLPCQPSGCVEVCVCLQSAVPLNCIFPVAGSPAMRHIYCFSIGFLHPPRSALTTWELSPGGGVVISSLYHAAVAGIEWVELGKYRSSSHCSFGLVNVVGTCKFLLLAETYQSGVVRRLIEISFAGFLQSVSEGGVFVLASCLSLPQAIPATLLAFSSHHGCCLSFLLAYTPCMLRCVHSSSCCYFRHRNIRHYYTTFHSSCSISNMNPKGS